MVLQGLKAANHKHCGKSEYNKFTSLRDLFLWQRGSITPHCHSFLYFPFASTTSFTSFSSSAEPAPTPRPSPRKSRR
jgi:hypothetical protein